MMSESIDDALDNDEAEDEREELTNQVNVLPSILDFFSFIYFTLNSHIYLVAGSR